MAFSEAWTLAFPPHMWILAVTAAALCALGFKKFVWFISVGYGFAVAGEGVAMLALFAPRLNAATGAALVLLTLYALRLGGFLALREIKSASYRREAGTFTKDGGGMKPGVKLAIWVSVVALYVAQVSPLFYRLANAAPNDAGLCVGLAVMLLGVSLEAIADRQKAAAKAKNPDRFCAKGLFSFVRCPNYLGELLLWTGVYVAGLGALRGPVQWAVATLGYLAIAYIMFSGARRLELRQNKRYGEDPAYREYVSSTPILIPFVPLYSVADWKFVVV